MSCPFAGLAGEGLECWHPTPTLPQQCLTRAFTPPHEEAGRQRSTSTHEA